MLLISFVSITGFAYTSDLAEDSQTSEIVSMEASLESVSVMNEDFHLIIYHRQDNRYIDLFRKADDKFNELYTYQLKGLNADIPDYPDICIVPMALDFNSSNKLKKENYTAFTHGTWNNTVYKRARDALRTNRIK